MIHSYAYYIFAFIFVLALIGLFGVALSFFTRQDLAADFLNKLNKNSKKRRLSVIEQRVIDPHHRLVLVGCDGKDYLLLLGKETNLQLSQPLAPVHAENNEDNLAQLLQMR